MEALLSFSAAIAAIALAGRMAERWRARRAPELLAWSAGMVAYAVSCGALGWGTAVGWDSRVFRVYYLFGGLLTPPLLAVGSLLLKGQRWATPVAFLYTGVSVGVAVSVPLVGHVSGKAIPDPDHVDVIPARLLAVIGNSVGTLVVIAAALLTFYARPLGNFLIVAAMVVASVGSVFSGVGLTAAVAAAAVLLYLGFAPPRLRR